MGKNKYDKAPGEAAAGRKKRRRRRNNQVCFKCRQKGHFIGQCPQLENIADEVNGENVPEVEEILDYRRDPLTNEHSYYIKWKGNEILSWEVARNLTSAIATVVAYHRSVGESRIRSLARIRDGLIAQLKLEQGLTEDLLTGKVELP